LIVEQLVILAEGEEEHGFIIFGRYTVCQVVLLEVEQAACTRVMMTISLE
jgi:hypothetical protein